MSSIEQDVMDPAAPSACDSALAEALEHAEVWAEHGYTAESRAYWRGMRDTLAVITGHTTSIPMETGPDTDAAALVILSAQARNKKRKY